MDPIENAAGASGETTSSTTPAAPPAPPVQTPAPPATKTRKTLGNSDVSGAKKAVRDIKVVGNGDSFRLLCKASSESEGWMKSSKAMEIENVGCVVQVTTQQINIDGTNSIAEALTFVHGVRIADDENGGRKLVAIR